MRARNPVTITAPATTDLPRVAGCRPPPRRTGVAIAIALLAFALPGPVQPAGAFDGFPARPIRLIVPALPGGTSDTLARILSRVLAEGWNQPVVIDSRPGAHGLVGLETAARAAPDGHTLLHATLSQFAINPWLLDRPAPDALRELVPISLVAVAPQLLVVHPELPVRTVPELIEHARQRPGQVNFGSGGPGTPSYAGAELFQALARTGMVHVPYNQPGVALNELIGGQIQVALYDLSHALPHVTSGKLRALAITSPRRNPTLPALPSVAEGGVPGFSVVNWWGVLGPHGLPGDRVALLNAELARVHTLPALRTRYRTVGVEATSSSPGEFIDLIRADMARFAAVARPARAK